MRSGAALWVYKNLDYTYIRHSGIVIREIPLFLRQLTLRPTAEFLPVPPSHTGVFEPTTRWILDNFQSRKGKFVGENVNDICCRACKEADKKYDCNSATFRNIMFELFTDCEYTSVPLYGKDFKVCFTNVTVKVSSLFYDEIGPFAYVDSTSLISVCSPHTSQGRVAPEVGFRRASVVQEYGIPQEPLQLAAYLAGYPLSIQSLVEIYEKFHSIVRPYFTGPWHVLYCDTMKSLTQSEELHLTGSQN